MRKRVPQFHLLAVCLLLACFVMPAQAQFTWQTFQYQNDIWMRTYWAGTGYFDYRVSCGGTLGNFRDCTRNYATVLPPSFGGESTDRIIQWTHWSDGIVYPYAYNGDKRFNETQGGCFNNTYSPSYWVDVWPGGIVDVYSSPQDHWNPDFWPQMGGKIACMTRYQLTEGGYMSIRRIVRMPPVWTTWAGTINSWPLYDEAWTPFDYPTFTAMAMAVDSNCNPLWWYAAHNNIPVYPGWSVGSTYGYAMVYNAGAPTSYPAIGVVFGTQQPLVYAQGVSASYAFNSMDFDRGICILPGITVNNASNGLIIDQTIYVIPRAQRQADLAGWMSGLSPVCPRPVVYPANYPFGGELQTIVNNLNDIYAAPTGYRTQNLAPITTWH